MCIYIYLVHLICTYTYTYRSIHNCNSFLLWIRRIWTSLKQLGYGCHTFFVETRLSLLLPWKFELSDTSFTLIFFLASIYFISLLWTTFTSLVILHSLRMYICASARAHTHTQLDRCNWEVNCLWTRLRLSRVTSSCSRPHRQS